MFFSDITSSGAIPALTATLQFSARRHEQLAANVANLNTPNFQPRDVEPAAFQKALGEAIDGRRARFGGHRGGLEFSGSREIGLDRRGNIRLAPKPINRAALRHDRNNSDLDSTMKDIAENTMVYRMSAELLRSRFNLIQSAITERV